MSINTVYDVIVIGGGPAGMMAAGHAAKRGLRVLLLEKNTVVGKKLSITGGGRCNVTNAEPDVRAFLAHYKNAEPFLYSAFSQFDAQDTFRFFTEHTLPLVVEDRQRAFPTTQKATDVTHLMEVFMKNEGVVVHTQTTVNEFVVVEGVITGVATPQGVFQANAFILATGGRSRADTGSTGEGLMWLKALGHTVHESNPSLVPLVVHDTWVKKLSGTTLRNVKITFTQGTENLSRQGDILCTHFGLTGPLILNSAKDVQEMLVYGPVKATIDLFPKEDVGTLRARFQSLYEAHPNKTLFNLLREWFPQGIVESVLTPLPNHVRLTKSNMVSREARLAIIDRMKSLSLTVTGTKGYEWAVVSDGGVDLKEVDTKTMRSNIHKNLYLIGDVLHIDRPSGGFSLQICWTTGFVAGKSV